MSVLAVVFIILSVMVALVFLIDCIRFWKRIKAYVKYGMACGLILLAIDAVLLALIPNALSIVPIHLLIVTDFLAFVRMALCTCMGMYCCSVLKIHAFAAFRPLEVAEERTPLFSKAFFVYVIGTVVLGVGYSVVLFILTSPQISEALRRLAETQSARSGIGAQPSLLMAVIVLAFAFAEEIVFRLGIQNYVAKQFKLDGSRYWIAIVLTTAFWSLAHANTLNPEWVKIAQVFPLGLALGVLFRKYGTETCIFVHGLFNVIMMFVGPELIRL